MPSRFTVLENELEQLQPKVVVEVPSSGLSAEKRVQKPSPQSKGLWHSGHRRKNKPARGRVHTLNMGT